MSTAIGTHSSGTGGGPLSLMSCVRESSPLQDYEPSSEVDNKNVVTKRKFWNPKKWFRKKQKTGDDNNITIHTHIPSEQQKDVEGSRSRSTGELSTDEEPPRSHEIRNSTNMHPGLSVSHDSVFHPLNSASSDLELDGAQSSSSLSISQPLCDAKLQNELSSKLRLRRGRGDTSEDDEGLPRSPPCGSPATATDSFLILEKTANNKDLPTKSHSTCSDGSLLSMDSSEMDEDSIGLQSRHSSKVSLNEKRPEQDLELEFAESIAPLNHSAAHHRVSVRPKRTYGAPRRKKGQLASALPATPEVNEDSSVRSMSPESVTTEPITELYSRTARNVHNMKSFVPPEVKLKCNSLPAGATPPTLESFRVNRSRSNAGKSQDDASLLQDEDKAEKLSLFERLFPRRSGKKKKKDDKQHEKAEKLMMKKEKIARMEVDGNSSKITMNEEKKTVQTFSTTPSTVKTAFSESKSIISSNTTHHHNIKPTVAPRTGAASRQRIQPIDIPASPKENNNKRSSTSTNIPITPVSPEKSYNSGTSPIQVELENLLRQRQFSTNNNNSPKDIYNSPPQSPKSFRLPPSGASSSSSSTTTTKHQKTEIIYSENNNRIGAEDIRNKIKIAGLSSLQQRVLGLNNTMDDGDDDEDNSFNSLTDVVTTKITSTTTKPISKSHSFKNHKSKDKLQEIIEPLKDRKKSVGKAFSLDSIKNLEEPVLKSELKLTLKKPPVNKTTVFVEKMSSSEKMEINPIKSEPEIVSLSYKLKNDSSSLEVDGQRDKVILSESTKSSVNKTDQTVKTATESISVPNTFNSSSITISGPSHTAVVNILNKSVETMESSITELDHSSKKFIYKENQTSTTKIQFRNESTQVTKTTISVPTSVPEFLNKQLNKVDVRPTSNIVFSMKSPKISPEQESSPNTRPKTLFNFPSVEINANNNNRTPLPRKFSKEDVEIIEKDDRKDPSPPIAPTTPTQMRFKKNDSRPSSRKSSVISITSPDSSPPVVKDTIRERALKARSISLDSLKNDSKLDSSTTILDKTSQDSLVDKRSSDEVVLRRKSFARQKNDEEPELMKVFARRSLKLKDDEIEQIQESIADQQRQQQKRDSSDKENNTESVTTQEVLEKKIRTPTKEEKVSLIESLPVVIVNNKEEIKIQKQPLSEIKKTADLMKNNVTKDEPEVQLRRSLNNNIFLATQRAASLNSPKTVISDFHIKKQSSLNNDRRKTDQWFQLSKDESIEEICAEAELITDIVTKKTDEVRIETKKNFSQRRAEWEKRVQQAQK